MALTIADSEIEALAGRLQTAIGARSVEDVLRTALKNELRHKEFHRPIRSAEEKQAAITAARLHSNGEGPGLPFDFKALSDELWNND